MGTWGTGILDDDFARDVYDRYEDASGSGQPAEAIVKALVGEFAEQIADPDEGPVFWLALARAQWDYATVDKSVSARVEEIISKGLGLARWEEAGAKELSRRKTALAKFATTIATPRKTRKRIARPADIPFAVGGCLAIDLGDGYFGAAVVTRHNPGRSASHILSIVDFHGHEPPVAATFNPPSWLAVTKDPTLTIVKYQLYRTAIGNTAPSTASSIESVSMMCRLRSR